MNLSTTEKDGPSSTSSEKNIAGNDYIDEDRSNSGCSDGDGNVNLQDSEFTVDSQTNEPIAGTRWFGGIGTDFLHCLTDNVSPMVSGVATLVHKTAVAVANEISQLERDGELMAAAAAEGENEDYGGEDKGVTGSSIICPSLSFDSNTKMKSENLTLPWEVCQDSSHDSTVEGEHERIPVYLTDKELMRRIFALSNHDSTFLQPFSNNLSDANELQTHSLPSYWSTFAMDEPRVKLTNRILDIDEKLASAHSRLAGDQNFSETHFWKNYFFHCERVRADEFCGRKKQDGTTNTEIQPSRETEASVQILKHNDDEESLVPVGSDTEGEQNDELSFVIPSAPNTGDTFATSRSIDDDLVLVDTHGRLPSEIQLEQKH